MAVGCTSKCEIVNENRCCKHCDQAEGCPNLCEDMPTFPGDKVGCESAVSLSDNALAAFQDKSLILLEKIKNITNAKKDLEEKEKKLKEDLEKSMNEHGIKKFSNDFISITWVEPTTSETFDSKKFKEEQPKVYEKYTKTSAKKGYVKITVK